MEQKIGLQLYSLRDYLHNVKDLANVLGEIKKIGYDGVELACIDDFPHDAVAEAVKNSGLQVPGWHIGWDLLQNDLPGVIQRMKDFGCVNAVIPIIMEQKYRSFDGARRAVEQVRGISAQLQKEGIQLHYHNHNHELCRYEGHQWLTYLLDETAPWELKPEFDVYWIQTGGGDPVAFLEKYGDRGSLLHLKDAVVESHRLTDAELAYRLRAGVGAEVRITELGAGNMNLRRILAAARKAGMEWYIVEQDDAYGKSALDAVRIDYENLTALLGIK